MENTLDGWTILLICFVIFIFYTAWKIVKNAPIFDDDTSPTWSELQSRKLNKTNQS